MPQNDPVDPAEVARLRERLDAGAFPRQRVELAAYLGHAAAGAVAALKAAPHQMRWWLRDLSEEVDAELRLAAAEARLMRRAPSLLVEAFTELDDRSDAGSRGWRAATAILAALASATSDELDEVLGLAARASGAGPAREAIAAELIPWALGERDAVEERVAAVHRALER